MISNSQINLNQQLKSVAIMLQTNDTGDDYQLDSVQLADWLVRYDHWFKESVGIFDGLRPFALYNRQISLFGADLLSVPEKLKSIAATSIRMGYAVSITVDILDLYHNFDLVTSFCEESLLSSLGVTIDRLHQLSEYIPIEDFIQQIVNLKRPIGLIGSITSLRDYNILSLESINGTDITIYSTFNEYNSIQPSIPLNPIKSCATRLQLYIDNLGYMYPCLGLFGMVDYAMGHINDEINDTALSGHGYRLNLLQLMKDGPDIQKSSSPLQQRDTTLPWVCEQHRLDLLANA